MNFNSPNIRLMKLVHLLGLFVLLAAVLVFLLAGVPQRARADGGGFVTETPTPTNTSTPTSTSTSTPIPTATPTLVFTAAPPYPLVTSAVLPLIVEATAQPPTGGGGSPLPLWACAIGFILLVIIAASVLIRRQIYAPESAGRT